MTYFRHYDSFKPSTPTAVADELSVRNWLVLVKSGDIGKVGFRCPSKQLASDRPLLVL